MLRDLPLRTSHPLNHPHRFQKVPPRLLEHENGAKFSFELTGDRGAALVTRHETCLEDARSETAFEKYTKRHYKSWVAFARHKGYGNDIRPVLVSGFDMTRDFSLVAYPNEDGPISSSTNPIRMFAPHFLGKWWARCSVHTNEGLQQSTSPSRRQAVRTLFSRLRGAETATDKPNQCVFIRYYTMRWRKLMPMFPKVIRAGAGPHDLGPGDNRGRTFPELAVQYDSENTESSDQDPIRQSVPTTHGTGSRSNIVVRNPKPVWFLLSLSISALNLPPGGI